MLARPGLVAVVCCGLLCCGLALAQAPLQASREQAAQTGQATQTQPSAARSPADLLVDQLVANADLYRATLPSISAHEEIESEASRLIFHTSARAEAVMRVVRDPVSGELKESRQITALNGKAVTPEERPNVPSTLYGGFGSFQQQFFTAQERHCFLFTLLLQRRPNDPLELRIVVAPEPVPGCSAELKAGDLVGAARVDPGTHQLQHLERTFLPEFAEPRHLAPFASVDLAPTTVGDKTFWLPTTVVGTMLMSNVKGIGGDIKGKFVAHYSDYHRFTATATIVPSTGDPAPCADSPACAQ